jgi:hypothetical protein
LWGAVAALLIPQYLFRGTLLASLSGVAVAKNGASSHSSSDAQTQMQHVQCNPRGRSDMWASPPKCVSAVVGQEKCGSIVECLSQTRPHTSVFLLCSVGCVAQQALNGSTPVCALHLSADGADCQPGAQCKQLTAGEEGGSLGRPWSCRACARGGGGPSVCMYLVRGGGLLRSSPRTRAEGLTIPHTAHAGTSHGL